MKSVVCSPGARCTTWISVFGPISQQRTRHDVSKFFEIFSFPRKGLCAVLGSGEQHEYRSLAVSLSNERDMTFSNFRWRCWLQASVPKFLTWGCKNAKTTFLKISISNEKWCVQSCQVYTMSIGFWQYLCVMSEI